MIVSSFPITVGWLINVEGYVSQRKNFRPCAKLIELTAYQTLPIVEVAFLEDDSAFVSYIVVMTFGEYINEKSAITFISR